MAFSARYLDKTGSLIPAARRIICDKATECPHTGAYNTVRSSGSYLCRRCGLALFRADSQFSSGYGWPSFDAEISQAVKEIPDSDGKRIEILCNRCHGHLGHVFTGEYLTAKNRRYCVNSASIDFVTDATVLDSEEAILAGGCFWGVDFFLRQTPGVLKVEVGYSGGMVPEPTYDQVCQGNTGHYEVVRVLFDSSMTNYSKILRRFFEIHDPTQRTGQGPDLGQQYQSAIFYYNQKQREQAEDLILQLRRKGYDVATRLLAVQPFWPAEEYHQDYYGKHGKVPYCHRPVSRFD
ncbi:bifunctional methionine sulfoxide reductase B/A protein [Legionella oakridgensis]|uniref:bifunctional methionine sulfoxide reductase B/A protein n=1 Tax=Legionella oakridgensis TaxID=29423 RepID=UPI0003DE104D|nr:bifunctional methionine sulfoxide reductase B/A protein [Legionella oakridgensis]ETO92210.1 methionine-S-sulfoxide reductase [Legionella oakridgensis RV-2-2007]